MLKIGTVLEGKYRILDVIGRGGMSIVYLAVNERANKFWAVKEIAKADYGSFAPDRKELELMKGFRHPSIPGIADVIDDGDRLLIVMDYVEGRSLDIRLAEQGAQSEEKVLEWAKQLCAALIYLHNRNPPVIYRDLKPANVIVKPDGMVSLIDFGAAREYRPQRMKDTVSLGTRGYAAPEQYEENGLSDVRTDIYCLGVMLFQLLTGESPHSLRPIRQCNSAFSAGLEEIIRKCTQVRKEERYQSCAELLYALEHFQEQDRKYREIQKRKIRQYAFCLGGILLFLGLSGIFLAFETGIRKNSYEACLVSARNSVNQQEEKENYEKALYLDPFREEAWLLLLQECFLEDQRLTSEESAQLRELLIQYTQDGQTLETVFQKNKEGYARFSYEAGLAYFYKFEDTGSKKTARGYFETAAASGTLEDPKRKRAERLALISGYYAQIGQMDAAGDRFVSFQDYWQDLTELSAGNLVEEDNERTALVMYQELVNQIISRAAEFRDAGVEEKEMTDTLVQLEFHLENDFRETGKEMWEEIREEIQELLEEIRQARRVVSSAFEKERVKDG